ncbi:DUF2341 domain-containing protein [Fontisphaera persica]|uniref:DUF2341 domain-containing protein n=1 Tax=Fontisphaera persica TaxID=2974023 RepID=UPI0024C03A6D|nr:DUF2341 domain-containing protein [Fontisphaera persica]WCJ59993.1 DUF2341 domain-containing protein [Fontisphaera persica]
MKSARLSFIPTLTGLCLAVLWMAVMPAQAYYNFLLHQYNFEEAPSSTMANDILSGANGLLLNGTAFNGSGQLLLNDGVAVTTAHVALPGGLLSQLTNVTVEAWVYWTGGGNWQRIFDFGTSTGTAGRHYFQLTPNANGQRLRFVVSTNGNATGAERMVEAPMLLPMNQWAHVAVSYNYEARVATLYLNGQRVGYGVADIPLSAIEHTNAWLGRSQYSADAYFLGRMEDFRIHAAALRAPEIAASYANGPLSDDVDPGALQGVRIQAPTLYAWSSAPLRVLADFSAVTNVDVTVNEGVQYVSSNPSVITVNSNGVVEALRVGSATISATYGTMTASVVMEALNPDQAVLRHRYSFNESEGTTVLDLVGGAHGIVTNFYNNNGGVITNFWRESGRLVLAQAGTNAAYVDLPNGLISGFSAVTLEMWVVASNAPSWARVFDFGMSTGGEGASGTGTNYLFLAPQNPIRFESKQVDGNPNMVVVGDMAFPANRLVHVVCTYNYAQGQARLYVDGRLVGWGVPAMPLSALVDLNVWLGRSQYAVDPAFVGAFEEFRIYEGTLSHGDVAANYAAGPEMPATGGQETGLALDVGETMYDQQQARALLTYDNAANVDITRAPGVVFTSDNPAVLRVGANGLLLGQRNGTATVTVSYHGFTASRTVTVQMGGAPLVHRYAFNALSGTLAEDCIGNAHGALLGGAALTANGAVSLNGSSAYVDLPNGIISRLNDATFEAWVIWNGGSNWQRIFDFGSNVNGEDKQGTGVNYIFLSPRSGLTDTPAVFGGRWLGVPVDMTIRAPAIPTGVPVHMACTFDWSRKVARLFINGQYVGFEIPARPLSSIDDFNNWLGRSQFADPFLNGQILDFRIYNTSLRAPEIAANAAAGPNVGVLQNPGALTALRLSVSTNVLVAWQVGQLTARADFQNAMDVNVTVGDGVVYTSSDPTVAVVSDLGRIQTLAAGTTTITAQYPGSEVTASVTITVVAAPTPVAAGTLYVDLRATNVSALSTNWINEGTLGHFTRQGTATIETPAGTAFPGVFFNGSLAYVGPAAGSDLAGNSDRSIEVWVLNPAIATEETLVSMGARSLGDRQNASFNYGSSTGASGYGAIGFWGAANDVGWPDAASIPAAGQWHHIVYTYNGSRLATVYVDGRFVTSKTIGGDLATDPNRTVNIGAQRSGSSVNQLYFSGYINAVRVHGGLLTADQVLTNYLAGPVRPAVSVTALAAFNIRTNAADLRGQLLGMTAPSAVSVYYGRTDGGTNKQAWEGVADLGVIPWGNFVAPVSGLTPGSRYYFRAYGSNSVGEAWSSAATFVTYGPAWVENTRLKTLTPAYAHVAGRLVATNGLPTEARLYWGAVDGGTNAEAWSNVVNLGLQPAGELVVKIAGLQAGTTYYYRWSAVNEGGQSWAPETASFTPRAFQPLGYAYVMRHTLAGYNRGTILTNFPVLIRLNESIPGFQYSQFLSGSSDLRFTEPNGGELNYEIESWNPAGDSFVWVQVPELAAGAYIDMYWGKAGVSSPAYTTNGATWNDGFAGVWHMTNAVVRDSTPNGYHANFVNNPQNVTNTAGIIGPAQEYAGTANSYTAVGVINFTNLTLSAWVWCADASRDGMFMCKDGTPALNYGDLYFWQQGANLRMEVYNWGGDVQIPLANAGGPGQWIHLAATIHGIRHEIYTNGALAGVWYKAGPGVNNNQFQLAGSMKQSGRHHKGKLDEMRAEWVARPADWIWACYQNQLAPSQFVQAGAVVVRPLPLTFASPAVRDITPTTASATVRVLSDGGNGVTSWGVAWGVTPQPTDNYAFAVGMTNAPFEAAFNLTNLQPGTRYFVRGFASNAVEGVVASVDSEFYTEPLPAEQVVFSEVRNRSMTVGWTPGVGSSRSVVLMREGAPVTAQPADGVAYAANPIFGRGTPMPDGSYVVYDGTGSTVTVTDLNKNTTYYVAVFAAAGEGALLNYQIALPAEGAQTTANEALLEVAGELLIDLNVSRGLQGNAAGQVTNWLNYGTAGGAFSVDGALSTVPTYGVANGQPALQFNGSQHLKATFTAPPQITGRENGVGRSFSVEYWVFNPAVSAEEWVFSWARRGGPDGTYAAVGYGTHGTWGLAAHWGAPDLAFGEGIGPTGEPSMPPAGQWHHIVVTYDGTWQRAYVNGVLNAQETKNLNIYSGDPVTLGQPYESSYAYSGSGISFSGALAALRVHSRALTPGQVRDNFNMGISLGAGGVPVAILGQPEPAVMAAEYSAATFRVFAAGTEPVTYQWYRNGSPVTGATAPAYQIPVTRLSDDGAEFFCVAQNEVNGQVYSATSSVVTLTVKSAVASLKHRYSFNVGAEDSIGGAHGELMGAAAIQNGAVVLNGTAGTYVNLPAGLMSNYAAITFEFWASFGPNGNWSRVYDFGDQNPSSLGRYYVMFTPHSGAGDTRMSYGDADPGYLHELLVTRPGVLDGQTNVHVACVYDPPNGVMRMHINGEWVGSTPLDFPLSSIRNVKSWLGRALYEGDAPLNGSIDEFRIYDTALPAERIRQNYELGPDTLAPAAPIAILAQPASRTNLVGEAVSFAVVATSPYPIDYQWYFNGIALAGANQPSYGIGTVTLTNAGAYYVVLSNAVGVVTSEVATLTVISPVTAGDDGPYAVANHQPATIPYARLLTNDVGGPQAVLTVIAVDGASTNGAVIVTNETGVVYTPVPGYTGEDSFTYTVSDGQGGTATARVRLWVVAGEIPPQDHLNLVVSPGQVHVRFTGTPGVEYQVQRAEQIQGPWQTVLTIVCPAHGLIEFTDIAPPTAAGFYRMASRP